MQSEDFLNLFTLNSLTPRNPVPPHPTQSLEGVRLPHEGVRLPHEGVRLPHDGVRLPHEGVRLPHEGVRLPHEGVRLPQPLDRLPLEQQNNDIMKRINMLLGDSLDLNNLNFSVPMYKDVNIPNSMGQTSYTGTDLITNYPALAGLPGIGGQGLGYPEQLLPGLMNRTLEAQTPIKPCRAIRGDQNNVSSTPAVDERRMKERMYRTPIQKQTLFEESAYNHYNQDNKHMGMHPGMNMKTRSSPTDSDTSGISSDTSALSESYLIDLMNSLTISPPSPGMGGHQLDQNANEFYRQQAMMQNGDLRFPEDSVTTLVSPKLLSKPKITDVSHLFMTDCSDPNSIERAARLYRSAASICEATCTWSGQLPLRINQREPIYSCKVFLGGIPWDITEAGLERCFKPYGPVRVEWPGKDGKHPRFGSKDIRGYAYLLFESDKCVKTLLDNCSRDVLGGEYYYKVPSKRLPGKKVQVIPWILSDSNYVCQLTDRLDTNKTVFVGALHGMINAEALATIMNDLFGDVIYAGIDLDKHKYPIGSGRVTFSTTRSYMKAVCAAFVEVKTLKFTKTIQIDPYLEEDTLCQNCNYQKGRFFCRDQQCFRYYCQACWQWQHTSELLSHHKPLMRYKKNNGKDQQNQGM